ncbi:MAG: ABC transporter ATP-binding protein [Acidobacteria bacterium RIFCSPLOWO2_02_FULL_59_13]|nr:MAG: ABC transporter ATP-binding protein [Acidobacteria bacterium RIFCSPLOWO2_02_FULL_59_13]
MGTLIGVEGIEVAYGDIPVVRGVSIEVREGEAVAVIGPNGAGKTTLFKAIAGMLKPRKGRIVYHGLPIDGLRLYDIVKKGIVYVPAERELFPQMTVLENLELGAFTNYKSRGERLKFVLGLFPRLEERRRQLAGTLSGGEQQMLAIGRGLMARPKLLLLDEPSTGLAPLFVKEMYHQLSRLKEEGLTILLAEQQVPHALAFSERAYVLENGEIRLFGKSKDLLGVPEIQRTYLGVT